jgi:hypothetical protein
MVALTAWVLVLVLVLGAVSPLWVLVRGQVLI